MHIEAWAPLHFFRNWFLKFLERHTIFPDAELARFRPR